MQAGINAASNGDEVRIIDSREYNESVVVNRSIRLTSNVSSPTIFSSSSDLNPYNATINITVHNVTIGNITVKYNGTASRTNAIAARSVTNLTLRNLTAESVMGSVNNGNAIYLYTVTNSTIVNVTVRMNGTGDNTYGIYLFSGSSMNNITNTTIYTNGTNANHAILLGSFSHNNTLTSNTISTIGQGGKGIWLSSSYSNNITSNTITTGTAALGSSNQGIYVQSSLSNTMTSNTISTKGTTNGYGIYMASSANSNNITSNTITTNGTAGGNNGIYLDTSSVSNTMTSNTISTYGTSNNNGIRLESTAGSNTLTSNTITANGSGTSNHGIFLFSSSNNILSNIISANGSSLSIGIMMQGSSYNNITGNNVTTKGSGCCIDVIEIEAGSNHNIFGNNILTIISLGSSTTGSGMHFTSNINNTVAYATIFIDTAEAINRGLWFTNSSSNSISNSKITTNYSIHAYGIALESNSTENLIVDSIINATNASDIWENNTFGGQNSIINTTFNKTDINFTAGSAGRIFNKYRLDVTVKDSNSNAINGTVTIGNDTDSVQNSENPTSNFSVTTNSTGQITVQTLSEFMANATYNSSSGYLFFNNYTVNVSKAGFFSSSVSVNVSSYRSVTITLSAMSPVTVCSSGCTATSVQDAINLASDYFEVRITDSLDYNESVKVNKTGLTLTSIAASRPVIFSIVNYTMDVMVDNVTVRNLTIKYNGSSISMYSLHMAQRRNVTIANNTISNTGINNSGEAVYITFTNTSTISNNTIDSSGGNSSIGIRLTSSSYNNTISYNNISTSGEGQSNMGLSLGADSNTFSFNTISGNGILSFIYGAYVNGRFNTFIQNTISANGTSATAVRFDGGGNNTMTGNTITVTGVSSNYGVDIGSDNNTLVSNTINANGTSSANIGIYAAAYSYYTITGNTITTNGTNSNTGIHISNGNGFYISGNAITTYGTAGSNYGIRFGAGQKHVIVGNTIQTRGAGGSNNGIDMQSASNNILSDNVIITSFTGTDNYGIRMFLSSGYNRFGNNTIVTNTSTSHGIYLQSFSDNNTFIAMNVSTNATSAHGIYLENANNNTFYDSYLTSIQAFDVFLFSGNAGNATYLVNTSFNKTDINATSSNVGAKLFVQHHVLVRVLDGSSNAVDQAAINITDNGTFSVSSLLPAINLSSNSSGYASEVNLTEFMANGTYQAGTGNGFLYFGSYYFNASKSGYSTSVQSAVNESKTITLTLSSLNPPTTTTVSSGGGGGGGGGGGSSTSTEAKQSILIITVKPNTAVKGTFTNTLLDLREISFSSKTEATNARIEATQTSTKPSTALDLTNTGKESYKTYAYIDVTHTNIADADLTNVKLAFEINKSWLSDRGYTKDQVFLQRYADGKWSKLTTRLLSEDTKKYKFEADSPGLSTFVISIAVPVGAGVSTGGNAAPSVTEETTTTTVTESKQEETAKGGSPFATLFFVLILIIAGGAYAFKDKMKVRRA